VAEQRPLRIYVASSWRNDLQPGVVSALRQDGFEVYDFKNPPSRAGFGWRQLALGDPSTWSTALWREALEHPVAIAGFNSDMGSLRACDVCVLVLPCGRSAHLELGWAVGAGKRTVVLAAATLDEPELMVKMCHAIALDLPELRELLQRWAREARP
jgi:hypothetical protein